MTSIKRALEAAAGVGGEGLYTEDVFKTLLYDGDGTTTRTLTTGLDMAGEGGMIWTKVKQGYPEPGTIQDTEQGATKYIVTSSEAVQQTGSNSVKSFTSTGYTVGAGSITNGSGYKYVSWNFRKAEGFFDVVEWTSDATFDIISHNIGAVPGLIIYKCLSRDVSDDGPWHAWSVGQSNNADISFNTDDDETASAGFIGDATSTQVQFYTTSGEDYVAYFFGNGSEIFGENADESIIKAGSFTTTASWGMYNLELGWEPQWVLLKKISGSGDWFVLDATRGMGVPKDVGGDFFENTSGFYNDASPSDDWQLSSNNDAEESQQGRINPHQTGCIFPLGIVGEFIYVAIRRDMKTPTAGTEVFTPNAYSGAGGSAQDITLSMVPDACTIKLRNDGTGARPGLMHSRLADGEFQTTDTNAQQGNASDNIVFFNRATNKLGLPAGTGTNEVNGATSSHYICEAFRRAPGFFDIVMDVGTGVAKTVKHNLGVAPEWIWRKKKSDNASWVCYSNNDNTAYMALDSSNGSSTVDDMWDDTSPTDSVFTVGTDSDVNDSGEAFISYLWATVPGVSKVGTYTGTGTDNNTVDCGFDAPARYVVAKRFNSGGFWNYMDSARGFDATGTNPFLRYDGYDGAEITWDDYFRAYSNGSNSGFQLMGTGYNASGDTYVFLAIA